MRVTRIDQHDPVSFRGMDRFFSKVDQTGPVPAHRPELGPCWIWTGAITSSGYGRCSDPRRPRSAPMAMAHRYAYEMLVGPIPDGLELDHLCRVRECVRPDHLEPVTRQENQRRGETFAARNAAVETCPAGHPYDETNTYLWRGARACRMCRADARRRHRTKAA